MCPRSVFMANLQENAQYFVSVYLLIVLKYGINIQISHMDKSENQNLEASAENLQEDNILPDRQSSEEDNDTTDLQVIKQKVIEPNNSPQPHRKYGNMIVICQRPFLITLGPDYWCFIPAFIIFTAIAIFVTYFVFNNVQSYWFRAVTLLICGGFCLSYLAVAISNPGVVLESNLNELTEEENKEMSNKKIRKCKICNIHMKRGMQHCQQCDVCIEGYDHHCPWTSKCIGQGNLCRFYTFLAMVPVFLIFVFVAFSVVMANAAHQSAQLKRHVKKL